MQVKYKIILLAVFCISAILKFININAGGPQITIDDFSLYEGAFLVWFGNAPPQHAYLECWCCGITSLLTYCCKYISVNGLSGLLTLNLITNAYRDFYHYPDVYYTVYRSFLFIVDFATAVLVYKTAKIVLKKGFAPVLVTVLYLFAYNTFWCNLVGRPDTLVSFAAIIGLFFYLKSGYDAKSSYFWCSAAAFGVAAGLKLHGAFFAIFVAMDLFRTNGLKKGVKPIFILTLLSLLFFVIADGTLLFDPLKYVKARMLTFGDDISPWIKWGDQFLVILKGSAWIAVPFIFYGAFIVFVRDIAKVSNPMKSVFFIVFCWLAIFAAIRQMRAYWMLPVLPLFYIATVATLSSLKQSWLRNTFAVMLVLISFTQSSCQFLEIYKADLNGLRQWITENIRQDEPFYILGYSVLQLPESAKCIQKTREGCEAGIAMDLAQDLPFTYRHLKNWEELTALRLYDMLNNKSDWGYTFYSYYKHPLDKFRNIISLNDMNYIFVQQYFNMDNEPELKKYISENFVLIAERLSEGGGGKGLNHKIYRRRQG